MASCSFVFDEVDDETSVGDADVAPTADAGTDQADAEPPPPPSPLGNFSARYHCVEDGNFCLENNEPDIISISAGPGENQYIVDFSISSYIGTGSLDERTMTVTGRGADYSETNIFSFDEALETFTFTAVYQNDEGGGGECAGTASKIGPAAPLQPLGPCL